ncbi:MAG: hypothetical protein DIU78_020740 [Pseudomonadota bacterium]
MAATVVLVDSAEPRSARAADAPPSTASSEARELPPLPRPPSRELRAPTEDELREVDAKLAALLAGDASAREAAGRALAETSPRLVPALAARLSSLDARADEPAMERVLAEIRAAARAEERKRLEAQGQAGEVKTPDALTMLLPRPPRDEPAYRDLVHVVGISRMLTAIGTVEAVRTLIDLHARFGDVLRGEAQLIIERLGDRAVAALIETRRHPERKVVSWAKRQLDALGRAVPSEAVQIPDQQALADVLRAYGSVRDLDAGRIIVSFAGSERALVREAAREAIVMMGGLMLWHLRDAYEAQVGKAPPREWGWERTARELFFELDRARKAQVAHTFEAGKSARANGDYEAMRRAFDEVLARAPRFEHARELAEGYLEYAEKFFDARPNETEQALVRAARLVDDVESKRRIESLLLTRRASTDLARGIADTTLLERALELFPANARARKLLDELASPPPARPIEAFRWIAAGLIALAALVAIVLLVFRRKHTTPEPALAAAGAPLTKEERTDPDSDEPESPPPRAEP